jgi:hypothetical protein
MPKKKITPATFQPHLLAVLGVMTNFTANTPVHMKETYAPICKRMGITEEALGMSSHGSLTTHRMIGYAMRGMRDHGLGDFAKKGQWVLTAEGVKEALREAGEEVPVEEFDLDPEFEAEPEVAEVAKVGSDTGSVAMNEEFEAEVVQLPVVKTTHPYSDDPYIRGLAIAQTPCFGTHSERSKTCETCPLAVDCLESIKLSLAHFAAKLDAAEAEPEKSPMPDEAEPEKSAESLASLLDNLDDQGAEGPAGTFKITHKMVAMPGKAKVETLCSQCMGKMAPGTETVWVHSHGQFHVACVKYP